MTSNLHPTMAAALAPFAPPKSEVHQIVKQSQLQELHALDAKEREEMRRLVGRQNDVIRMTGGVL